MNVILIGFMIVGVFLIVILIYLLSMNKSMKKSTKKTNIQKNKISLLSLDIDDIQFPKNIENMDLNSLFKASKSIFDSYKALDYLNKSSSAMDKMEWHSWQLSILLYFLKKRNNLFISEKNDKLFHGVILQLNETQINQELQRIYRKYPENVDIYKNRDELSNDVMWTARDVSIILYKIINE